MLGSWLTIIEGKFQRGLALRPRILASQMSTPSDNPERDLRSGLRRTRNLGISSFIFGRYPRFLSYLKNRP